MSFQTPTDYKICRLTEQESGIKMINEMLLVYIFTINQYFSQMIYFFSGCRTGSAASDFSLKIF